MVHGAWCMVYGVYGNCLFLIDMTCFQKVLVCLFSWIVICVMKGQIVLMNNIRFSIANITINKNVLKFYCNELCGRQLSCFVHKCTSCCDESSDQSFMGWTLWAISHSSQCSITGVTGRGMCYPVCWMVHIKEPLLLIGKSSPCGGSGFPLIIWVVLYHMSDAI